MLQFHDARTESSSQIVHVGETSRRALPCSQRRPHPIRGVTRWIAGALLVPISAEIALAAWADSAVYYDPGTHSVSGYSQTVRDSWEEDIWNCWGSWELMECDVQFYLGVWEDVYFDSPSGPWAYGTVGDQWHALAIPPTAYSPEPGPWSVFAFHYIRWQSVTNIVCVTVWGGMSCYCPPENFCSFDTYDQLIDVTSDAVNVPDPGPPPPVHIEYAMFIPTDHVRLPSLWNPTTIFSGDGQSTYIAGSGTYRILQEFDVDLSSKTVYNVDKDSAHSQGYDPAIVLDPPNGTWWINPEFLTSTASCYNQFCPNCPQYPFALGNNSIVFSGYCRTGTNPYCDEAAEDMQTMAVNVVETPDSSVKIRFEGDPVIACVVIAADISWLHYLTISWDGQAWNYELDLEHDGFPHHQIRINGELVYEMDPLQLGKTPLSLALPKEIQPAPITGVLP